MTSSGIQEKLYRDGFWYKKDHYGNESIAEVTYSLFLEHSGVETVKYRLHPESKQVSVSKDFTEGKNFISAKTILDWVNTGCSFNDLYHISEKEKLDLLVSAFKGYGIREGESTSFIHKMNYFDSMLGNVDRHLGNFGIIVGERSVKMAPMFDFGMSFGVPEVSKVWLDPKTFHKEIIYGGLFKKDNKIQRPESLLDLNERLLKDLAKVIPETSEIWNYVAESLLMMGYKELSELCPKVNMLPNFTSKEPFESKVALTKLKPLERLPRR